MTRVRRTSCCGLRELDGITQNADQEQTLQQVIPELLAMDSAFVIFTCPTNEEGGAELALAIQENNLGNIIQSSERHNPQSGNDLRVYIWETDEDEMGDWYEERIAELERIRVEEEQERQRIENAETEARLTTERGGLERMNRVRHTRFGLGTVITFRTGSRACVGVQYDNENGSFHNLGGEIDSDRGLWCNQTYLTRVRGRG